MNCGNTLWIDAVGLYYIDQNFNLNIGKLIKTISEEIYPQKKSLGILLDGNSRERCAAYESPPDIKYVRTLRPIAEAFYIKSIFGMSKGVTVNMPVSISTSFTRLSVSAGRTTSSWLPSVTAVR